MDAGFTVLHEPIQADNDTIAVIDFEDCKDPQSVSAHLSRGVRIVALMSKTDSREMGLDEITPLNGILTDDLPAGAFVRSLRLIASGERVFPHDLALGRKSASSSHKPNS